MSSVFAQGNQVWITPNEGQWDEKVDYKIKLGSGDFYVEKNRFTFHFDNRGEILHKHDEGSNHSHDVSEQKLKLHALRFEFVGANGSTQKQNSFPSSHYENYYLGNNSQQWKSFVHSYQKIRYSNYYQGIDLEMEAGESSLKYSFFVQPNTDPKKIQQKIVGADKVSITKEGNLIVQHSLGTIEEAKPVAWTLNSSGQKTKVKVAFSWNEEKKILSYHLDSYNQAETLVIDPQITFSTYTGSISDNWGFTAAPDAAGNLYAGGIVFGTGYPTTTGALTTVYNGGQIDIGITKFNATGSALLFSTYLGGSRIETPHSLVTNANNELYVMGATSSLNFPTAGTPYQNAFGGGGPSMTENSLIFNGSDIFVARFNPNGTALLSSTYIGGSGNDGINQGNLNYNYGDQFRGEIILDQANNVYVSSVTRSSNFPTVGAFQTNLLGPQDAVIFKMNANLSTLLWSTYYGGAGFETGNSLQLSNTGNLYITGGTTSGTLNMAGGHQASFGGVSDGYLISMNATTGAFIKGTYIGGNAYDQSFFVQIDLNDKVYVFGQSLAGMAVTPGCYGNANGGQFIRKYSNDLAVLDWQTRIGSTITTRIISPTAFLVSDCFQIYISGWGGTVNHNAQATNSSTTGYQVTNDAFQNVTNGNNFYIAVLDQDATNLRYATFMGGLSSSSNHVDGGTSRFDKSGRIYHAVCGGCQGNSSGFTTTPGSWSPTHPSSNCNLAAFKFELNVTTSVIGSMNPVICMPSPVVFTNGSANSDVFHWDFGDGNTSTATNPSHVYQNPGNYTITLISNHSSGCFTPDTATFDIQLIDFSPSITQPPGSICPGESMQLEVQGGDTFAWSPAALLNNTTIFNPIATVQQTSTVQVIVSSICGLDTLTAIIPVFQDQLISSNDTTICLGNSVTLFSNGGSNYIWSPGTFLDNTNSNTVVCTPTADIVYAIEARSPNGCLLRDTISIEVFFTPPMPVIPDTVNLCYGTSKQVIVSGAQSYLWSPNIDVTPNNNDTVQISTLIDRTYYVSFTNVCGTVIDSTFVKIRDVEITTSNDTTICYGERAILTAYGAQSYTWHNEIFEEIIKGHTFQTSPGATSVYTVIGESSYGCFDTSSINVSIFPRPVLLVDSDVYAFYGEAIQLSANANMTGSYVWSPNYHLSCTTCQSPFADPDEKYSYYVTFTDQNNCSTGAKVTVHYDAVIYIPNTFTPDGMGNNDRFYVKGDNIKEFKMYIYNRWGELIFEFDDINDYWDGSYQSLICPDGTYVWQLHYTDYNNFKDILYGHVNLLR